MSNDRGRSGLAVLALAIALISAGCATTPTHQNTECSYYQPISVSRQYCLVSTSSGGCSRWSTAHELRWSCAAYRCKEGFTALDPSKMSLGCFAGDEYRGQRESLAAQEAERAKRLGNQGEAASGRAVFSPRGDSIAFVSASTTFAGRTDKFSNVFIKDLRSGAITRVSQGPDGAPPYGDSDRPRFSADGNLLVFDSNADNLVTGDANRRRDVFIKDLRSGVLRRIALAPDADENGAWNGVLSRDGSRIAVLRELTRPAPQPRDRCVTVLDLRSGVTTPLTFAGVDRRVCTAGEAAFLADSRRIVHTGNDKRGRQTLYTTDLQTGASNELLGEDWRRQSPDVAHYDLTDLTLSRDGAWLAFTRQDVRLQGKVPTSQIYLTEVRTARTTLLVPGLAGESFHPAFSPDGTRVAFSSMRTDLVPGDTNGATDVFVKDLRAGTVERISVTAEGVQGNSWSEGPQFSPDGTRILFVSNASNFVPGDTNGVHDVFVKNLKTGVITRVSVPAGALPD